MRLIAIGRCYSVEHMRREERQPRWLSGEHEQRCSGFIPTPSGSCVRRGRSLGTAVYPSRARRVYRSAIDCQPLLAKLYVYTRARASV